MSSRVPCATTEYPDRRGHQTLVARQPYAQLLFRFSGDDLGPSGIGEPPRRWRRARHGAGPVITASVAGILVWLVVAVAGPRLAHRLAPAWATRLLVAVAVVVAGSTLTI